MIYNANQATPPPAAYDVCIVGAGAAGLTLATQLLAHGKRVLLLESGGRLEDEPTAQLKQVRITGRPHTGATDGRFRLLGGTTTRWGGQFAEFDEHDFLPRPWLNPPGEPSQPGRPAWPFPKSELRPFYDRAYAAVGLDPNLAADPAVWDSLHIPQPPRSEDISLYFTRWCPQPDFSRLYSAALEHDSRLDVCLHTNAVEMLTDPGGRVHAIRCVTLAGAQLSFAAHTFVLALGTIETNRFLLQPDATGSTRPWHSSPLLGRHFQDHLAGYCGLIHVRNWPLLRRYFETAHRRGLKYHPKLKLLPAAQQRGHTLNAGGTVNFLSSPRLDATMTSLKSAVAAARRGRLAARDWAALLASADQLPTVLASAASYALRGRPHHAPASTTVLLGTEAEQDPSGRSRITLDSTRDATGLLRASLDWHISPLEVETVRHFAINAAAWLESSGIASVDIDPDLLHAPDRFTDKLHDTYHPSGGTRIGTSPADGVVDPSLQLFGTPNVYVLSGSVFPTSSYSNPTFTLLALACRLADYLAQS